MNFLYCNNKTVIDIEPSDTIESIASYTHFTAVELCKILNGIIRDKEEVNKAGNDDENPFLEEVNCKNTKCNNCVNHNYCDYEPYKAESEDKE